MNFDELPLATDEELVTLPPGLYVACAADGVPLEREVYRNFHVTLDRFVEGPAVLLARVVAKGMGLIPNTESVESVLIRPNGDHVIKQWVSTGEAGHGPDHGR